MNLQQVMKQAQAWQKKIADIQTQLETMTVVGVSGAGAVRVTTTPKGVVEKVEIDPSSITKLSEKEKLEDSIELLEDLIVAAFKDAKRKSDALVEEMMGNAGVPTDMLKMVL